jgi:hypothetical protein
LASSSGAARDAHQPACHGYDPRYRREQPFTSLAGYLWRGFDAAFYRNLINALKFGSLEQRETYDLENYSRYRYLRADVPFTRWMR